MLKCRECGAEMYLDDTDRIKQGHKDEYWNCPKCKTSCIKTIRCGLPMYELWHSENNDDAKDYYVDLFGGR